MLAAFLRRKNRPKPDLCSIEGLEARMSKMSKRDVAKLGASNNTFHLQHKAQLCLLFISAHTVPGCSSRLYVTYAGYMCLPSRIPRLVTVSTHIAHIETYAHTICALLNRGPAFWTGVDAVCKEVCRQSARSRCQRAV